MSTCSWEQAYKIKSLSPQYQAILEKISLICCHWHYRRQQNLQYSFVLRDTCIYSAVCCLLSSPQDDEYLSRLIQVTANDLPGQWVRLAFQRRALFLALSSPSAPPASGLCPAGGPTSSHATPFQAHLASSGHESFQRERDAIIPLTHYIITRYMYTHAHHVPHAEHVK